MRILCLMRKDIFRLSLGWVLESLGHQVYYLNELKEDLLQEGIRIFQPDLFMDVGWDFSLKKIKEVYQVVKRHRLFHVYFAEEDYLHFERWSKRFVLETRPNMVLTRSERCIPEYEKMGIRAINLDVGSNPDFHRPVDPDPSLECDISVAANPNWSVMFHNYRDKSVQDLIFPLFQLSYKVNIWGKDWDKIDFYYKEKTPQRAGLQGDILRGILPFHRTPYLYSSSKINISLQSVEDQVSNRTYDILTAGGFLLTSDTPGVRALLTPGVHCEVSNSPEETVEKINYFLNNEEERRRIAQNGMEYAREKFSYQRSLPVIWNQVEESFKKHHMTKTR